MTTPEDNAADESDRFVMETGPNRLPYRDWPEDFPHENGNYFSKCVKCGHYFKGHKRRVVCNICAEPNWIEIAKKQPPEDNRENKAWAGAWLEGEMVGYARCMVKEVARLQAENTRLTFELKNLYQNAVRDTDFVKAEARITELEGLLKGLAILLNAEESNFAQIAVTRINTALSGTEEKQR